MKKLFVVFLALTLLTLALPAGAHNNHFIILDVKNAANGQHVQDLSPRLQLSLYGLFSVQAPMEWDHKVDAPTNLGGIQANFLSMDGVTNHLGKMLYVSPTQVNVEVPEGLPFGELVLLSLSLSGEQSPPTLRSVLALGVGKDGQATSVGLYEPIQLTTTPPCTGPGDACRAEVQRLHFFGTGLAGKTTSPYRVGEFVDPNDSIWIQNQIEVFLDGRLVESVGSRITPGLSGGPDEILLESSDGFPSGPHSAYIVVGGIVSSNTIFFNLP